MSTSEDGTEHSVPKVLARGTACHQCRRRKLKCDAIRPICSHCKKPRIRSGNNESFEVECTWDEVKEPSARTRRKRENAARSDEKDVSEEDEERSAKKQEKLNHLEDRIAAFEQILGYPASMKSVEANLGLGPLTSDETSKYDDSSSPGSRLPFGTQWINPAGNNSGNQTPASEQNVGSKISGPDNIPDMSAADQAGIDELLGLIWPDWPADLPSQVVVEHMVQTFFDKVPTIPRMFHRATFMANLQYPPSHYKFPAAPLLHAILAVTAPYVSESSINSPAYYPSGTPSTATSHPIDDLVKPSRTMQMGTFHLASSTPLPDEHGEISKFGIWHRRKAFEGITPLFDRGEKLVQCFQATAADWMNAWWTDLWLETGTLIRLAVPIHLHETCHIPGSYLERHDHSLIEPASDPLEQAERERSWWVAYYMELSVTASTTWPSALAEDEITVELPCLQSTFDLGLGDLSGVQSLQAVDIFSHHPPQHLDSFCFLIKSVKLFSDVNTFLRRYSRGPHSLSKYLSDPRMRLLLSHINSFRLSFPPHMRRPTKGSNSEQVDGDLLTAISMTHGATLNLGEPLITKETWNTDMARMTLSAIRAVLSLLYDISSTSYDLSLLSPNCAFVWCLCARGLVRFMEAARQAGDSVSTMVFRSELQVFRLAILQYGERLPLGQKQLRVLDQAIARYDAMEKDVLVSLFQCPKEEIFPARSLNNSRPASNTSPSASLSTGSASGSGSTPSSIPLSYFTPEQKRSMDFVQSNLNSEFKFPQGYMTNNQIPGWDINPNANIASSFAFSTATTTSIGINGMINSVSNVNGEQHNFSGPNATTPAIFNVPSDGFDIASFSFDADSIIELLGGNDQFFDGNDFGMKQFAA